MATTTTAPRSELEVPLPFPARDALLFSRVTCIASFSVPTTRKPSHTAKLSTSIRHARTPATRERWAAINAPVGLINLAIY